MAERGTDLSENNLGNHSDNSTETGSSYLNLVWERGSDNRHISQSQCSCQDDLKELRRAGKMIEDDEIVFSKRGKKSSSLNRAHSVPLTNRSKSKKRFVAPRNSVDDSVNEAVKVTNSGSVSRRKNTRNPNSLQLIDFKAENSAKTSFDESLCTDFLDDVDEDWDDANTIKSDIDFLEDVVEDLDDASTVNSLTEEEKIYEEALLRSLMLFNDTDDEFDDEIFMNLDVLGLDDNRLKDVKNKAAPNFPCGPEIMDDCLVCFEKMKLRRRLCCDFAVCDVCMEKYLIYEVERGVVKIECINGNCDSYVHRDEILGRLPLTMKEKYYRFLVDANKDPNIKTCPRCSHIYNRIEKGVRENQGKFGVLVECPDCKLLWCFECQAPWHTDFKCKEFQKGDNLLKSWAKEQHFGHQNAQKCPRCKIFIERKGGCDHMVCTKCNTSFCYRCGDRFVDLKFFGNHLSRLSPLGCKYNYKPDDPVKRKLVRGSLLGVKLLGGVVLVGLGLAAGAILVGASVIILPVLGGYKYHKFRKIRKRHRKQQKLFSLRTRRAMMESLREQAVLEYVSDRHRTWPRQEPRDGPVHIGIQTGPSQQVDVTVHNPYHPDGPRDESNLNSEIIMDIRDDVGRVTRTTAEVMPGGSNDDEGDVVLHVKTQYNDPPQENPDIIKDSEKADEKEAGLEASGKSSAYGSVSSRSSSCFSSRRSCVVMKTKSKKSRKNSGSQSEKKEVNKTENDHSIKKTKENSTSNEPASVSAPLPDLGLRKSLNSSQEEDGEHLDDNDQNDPISHSETGCFLKLFSKKLQNLEKEKYTIPKTESKENDQDFQKTDFKEKDLHDCPDIVSCTLQAALKTQEADIFREKDKPEYSAQSSCSSGDLELDSPDYCDHDPYFGMISTETYKTFL